MNKIIIGFLIVTLFPIAINAQTKILGRKVFDRGIQNEVFIPKGQWMVGSTISYSEHEDNNFSFLGVLQDIESIGYSFKVSPFFGYFIKDNIAVGGRFSYKRTYTDLGNISLDIDEDINFNISDIKYLEHDFSTTGFVRTYMPIGKSKVFGLFNEARLTYSYSQGKNTSGVMNTEDFTGTYQTVNKLQVGMCPGLTAFITNFAAVEVSVDVLGFDIKWTEQVTDQVETGSRRSSSADFKIDLFSINLGINFYF